METWQTQAPISFARSKNCWNGAVLELVYGTTLVFQFQPVWKTYLNVTDRQTDGRTTYCGITALCIAARGKNESFTCNCLALLTHDPTAHPLVQRNIMKRPPIPWALYNLCTTPDNFRCDITGTGNRSVSQNGSEIVLKYVTKLIL